MGVNKNPQYLIPAWAAARFDALFEAFYDFGKAATALYAENRYPFINWQDVPRERLREIIEEVFRHVDLLTEELKDDTDRLGGYKMINLS